MKTRERILHTSLELFNELGEPNVTTLLIADELDISPGNLYYHFKSKTDIVEELFDWYEAHMMSLLNEPSMSVEIEDQWLFLHLVFEGISKYRFIYKDLVNLNERYDKVNSRFQKIMIAKRDACLAVFQGLREAGTIIATDEEVTALTENLILTATFWINYVIITRGDLLDEDLTLGVHQLMVQLAPYMADEQRALLETLKQAYL